MVNEMTSKEVAGRVINQEKLFILDVRNESDFQDWKIEGEHFMHLNIPYFKLLDGVEPIIDQLPTDQEVLVVCAKEGSAKMVADLLSAAGRSVSYLKGGMEAWSEYMEPIQVGRLKNGGEIYQFVRIGKGCLSYMVVSNGEAVLIDPIRMTEVYMDFADSLDAKITHVLDTHLHADHISGGRAIAEQTGATYWLPPKDAGEVTFSYHPLEEGKLKIADSAFTIHALYSPGHTIGSTSLIIDDQFLLTGDVLFIDSIGRPDLAGRAEEWVSDLRKTLYERYRRLPEELLVLPAHFMKVDELNEDGSISERLGTLYRRNHGLTIESETLFQKVATENLPPQPNAYQKIRQTNMGKINPDPVQQREMEIGPNRCAVR